MNKTISILLCITVLLLCVLPACGCQNERQNSPGQTSATADSAANSVAAAPGMSAPSTSAADTIIPAAQSRLNELAEEYGFEGVITVCRDGKRIAEYASGTADPETGARINTGSLFCIGSVSKQFAAASVMLLQERGALSVDDTLDKYFPDCPYGKDVTLRQMLKMRSGIAEFYDTYDDGHNLNEIPVGELEGTITNQNTAEENRDTLQKWLFEQPLHFTPGSEVEYCNSNYFLMARLAEKVSGMPYETFVRQNIFEPLKMESTGFIDEMPDDPRFAKNAKEAKTVYVGVTMGLGDMISCAEDMERWMSSFFGNGLLSAESIAMMTLEDDYSGYGFGVVPDSGGSWFHSGVFTSYRAFDYADPQARLTMFAVTNNQGALRGELSDLCFNFINYLAE